MFRFFFILSALFLAFFQSVSMADKVSVFTFSEEEFEKLQIKKVKGKTTYSINSNVNGNYLKAEAKGKASGLGKEVKVNLLKTPIINITWKIEKDLKGIFEDTKKGHDYAARVFVIKKTGSTALSNRAINYVFSSNNSVGENWPSPYTKKSIDYVLSTTKEHLNEWITVKANVRDHFQKFHNLDVEALTAVAVMTDTDNSKMKAVAYYQNIYFSSE